MRLNVYSQEMLTDGTTEVAAISELVEQVANTGIVYSAVRLFFHSSPMLHHPPIDDDRSAVTFWLPKSAERREFIAMTFERMARLVRQAKPETGLD